MLPTRCAGSAGGHSLQGTLLHIASPLLQPYFTLWLYTRIAASSRVTAGASSQSYCGTGVFASSPGDSVPPPLTPTAEGTTNRRRLAGSNSTDGLSEDMSVMLNRLITVGIVAASVLLLNFVICLWWRRRVNRGYYALRAETRTQRASGRWVSRRAAEGDAAEKSGEAGAAVTGSYRRAGSAVTFREASAPVEPRGSSPPPSPPEGANPPVQSRLPSAGAVDAGEADSPNAAEEDATGGTGWLSPRRRANARSVARQHSSRSVGFSEAPTLPSKQASKLSVSSADGRASKLSLSSADGTRVARFHALPSIFVFPNLLSIGFALLASGLIAAAAGLLIAGAGLQLPHHERLWVDILVGSLVAAAVVIWLGATVWIILSFHRAQKQAGVWAGLRRPGSFSGVSDPLFRLVSRLIGLCGVRPFERAKGGFERSEEERLEPARTERLLRSPFAMRRRVTADVVDANGIFWLAKATGDNWFGVLMQPSVLLVQISLQALAGIGPSLARGYSSASAFAQAGTICGVQLGFGLLLFVLVPMNDRFENHVVAAQFTLEGIGTLMLIVAAQVRRRAPFFYLRLLLS